MCLGSAAIVNSTVTVDQGYVKRQAEFSKCLMQTININKTLSLSLISMPSKDVRVLTDLGNEYISNKNEMNVTYL